MILDSRRPRLADRPSLSNHYPSLTSVNVTPRSFIDNENPNHRCIRSKTSFFFSTIKNDLFFLVLTVLGCFFFYTGLKNLTIDSLFLTCGNPHGLFPSYDGGVCQLQLTKTLKLFYAGGAEFTPAFTAPPVGDKSLPKKGVSSNCLRSVQFVNVDHYFVQ